MHSKTVEILGRRFLVNGDSDYLNTMGDRFEPETSFLLSSLCSSDSHVLDIGANIGMTALALSQICVDGRVVALEPVPRTYELLTRNLSSAHVNNVAAFNFGAGSRAGSFTMQGAENNAAGAFVANQHTIHDAGHFSATVQIKRIDDAFGELELQRLDLVKIDVEGFELHVLEGAKETICRFKPRILLEMNHWCLNAFHRTSLPEFRDRLLKIFPFVYAVQFPTFLDFGDEHNVHHIYYRHLTQMQFMNIVAGFDREDLLRRLQLFAMSDQNSRFAVGDGNTRAEDADSKAAEAEKKAAEAERRLDQVLRSISWRATKPLRALRRMVERDVQQ